MINAVQLDLCSDDTRLHIRLHNAGNLHTILLKNLHDFHDKSVQLEKTSSGFYLYSACW